MPLQWEYPRCPVELQIPPESMKCFAPLERRFPQHSPQGHKAPPQPLPLQPHHLDQFPITEMTKAFKGDLSTHHTSSSFCNSNGAAVAYWLGVLACNRRVAGSIPDPVGKMWAGEVVEHYSPMPTSMAEVPLYKASNLTVTRAPL